MKAQKSTRALALIAILTLSGSALADDVLPPPWRGEDRTLTAVWDTWPDGVPNWWLDIPPDTWSSSPTLPTAPWADLGGGAFQDREDIGGLGRLNTVVTFDDFEVELIVPNYSENEYKDIWVQITYFPWTFEMLSGFAVDALGIEGSTEENFEGWVVHPDGWVTEAWSRRIWPNPSEEGIALYFIDLPGVDPYPVVIDQVVIDTRCVPEPATMSLLVLGGLGALARRRRKWLGLIKP